MGSNRINQYERFRQARFAEPNLFELCHGEKTTILLEHKVAAIAENLFLICAYLREVMWKQACLYSYLT